MITRHGKPATRLVHNNRRSGELQVQAAFDRIRARAHRLKRTKPSSFKWTALKKLRDQGRP